MPIEAQCHQREVGKVGQLANVGGKGHVLPELATTEEAVLLFETQEDMLNWSWALRTILASGVRRT